MLLKCCRTVVVNTYCKSFHIDRCRWMLCQGRHAPWAAGCGGARAAAQRPHPGRAASCRPQHGRLPLCAAVRCTWFAAERAWLIHFLACGEKFQSPGALYYMLALDHVCNALPVAAVLLEQACEMLTLTCALELRAALERATLLTSQQNARSLVEQVQHHQPIGLHCTALQLALHPRQRRNAALGFATCYAIVPTRIPASPKSPSQIQPILLSVVT
jgi:hypothetical protein